MTEVCYLLEREAGPRVEAAFLESISEGDFTVVRPRGIGPLARVIRVRSSPAEVNADGVEALALFHCEQLQRYAR